MTQKRKKHRYHETTGTASHEPAIMEPFSVNSMSLGALVALALGVRALKKKTLTVSGTVAGCSVGFLLVSTGLRGLVLLYFYQLGSMATKFKKSIKERRDATVATHSARSASQVLAVSITTVVLSLYHAVYCGAERSVYFVVSELDDGKPYLASSLTCAVLAHHATCLADTLASELGILSQQKPFLITQPWRRVPPGTNGGITMLGTFWSALGGFMIGLLTVAMDLLSGIYPLNTVKMILFGTVSGLIGSLVDSLIGATLQSSYYDSDTKLVYHASSPDKPKTAECISGVNILTNEEVNFVSALVTAILGGWVLAPFIFGIEFRYIVTYV